MLFVWHHSSDSGDRKQYAPLQAEGRRDAFASRRELPINPSDAMAEPRADDPRPQGEYPEQPRTRVMTGIIALGVIVFLVIIAILVWGMLEPGERQDTDEAPTEQQEVPEQDPSPSSSAVSFYLVENV